MGPTKAITGRTYLFCYRPSVPRAIDVVLRDAVSVVKGEPVAPLDIGAKLARRFALVGVASVVRMALSGLDAALWDALAVAVHVPARHDDPLSARGARRANPFGR